MRMHLPIDVMCQSYCDSDIDIDVHIGDDFRAQAGRDSS
jgi:hypothetical protein